jgi:hypothetical protein
LFISPANTFPGPHSIDIGDPDALVNRDACVCVKGRSPDGHEMKNTATRLILAGILKPRLTITLLPL